MNTVANLLKTPFKTRHYEDKIKIKSLGPDRPDLHLTQTVNKGGGKKTDRKFNKDWYNKKTWLTGCAKSNSLFCFCCLLYGGDDTWAKKGTKDIKHLSERFSFSGHLTASKLFYSNMYPSYSKNFPEAELNSVIKAYPFFDKLKLKTEFRPLYSQEAVGPMPLLRFLLQNNLEEIYSETVSLLRVLVTTPMTTSESERCFSTLKRIKTFLRSTMTEDRLNALAMIAIERKMCQNKDFFTKVIDKFSQIKERRLDFLYK
jgi:hypothetical protein